MTPGADRLSVLHVVGRLDVGGVETYLLDFVTYATGQGVTSKVLTMFERREGSLAAEFRKRGAEVFSAHALRSRRTLANDFFRALGNSTNVVHSHLGDLSGDAMKLAARFGIARRIAQSHNVGSRISPFLVPYRAWSRRVTVRHATQLAAVSGRTAAAFGANHSSHCRIIPIGLDPKPWVDARTRRASVRESLGLRQDETAALHAARFDPVKNHEFALHIARAFADGEDSVTMLFAGDGPTRIRVESLAERIGLMDRVRFLGPRTDLPDLMSACDVLILPSLSEGSPRVLAEASASGLPFVCSASCDAKDLYPTQTFLDLSSPQAWAQEILRVARMGRENELPETVHIAKVFEKTLELYVE